MKLMSHRAWRAGDVPSVRNHVETALIKHPAPAEERWEPNNALRPHG
jgi:hypothetical protein